MKNAVRIKNVALNNAGWYWAIKLNTKQECKELMLVGHSSYYHSAKSKKPHWLLIKNSFFTINNQLTGE